MRPKCFEIEGLFSRTDTIRLDLSANVKIIYGINGSGKTTILKLLDAILTGRLFEIRNVNFKSLILRLEDGRAIKATKAKKSSEKGPTRQPVLSLKLNTTAIFYSLIHLLDEFLTEKQFGFCTIEGLLSIREAVWAKKKTFLFCRHVWQICRENRLI